MVFMRSLLKKQNFLKKILWISGHRGWAYNNHFNRIKAYSRFDHIVICRSEMNDQKIFEMIDKIKPDLIISGSLKARKYAKDFQKFIFVLDGNRQLNGWKR